MEKVARGIEFAIKKTAYLESFPDASNSIKERGNIAMKNLKQLLFAAAFTVCVFAGSASAQKDDKKPPPKGTPPVVVVGDKKDKPKEEKPKDDKKKPQSFMFFFKNE